MSEKIQPRPTPTSEPYWQGCREERLRLQYCGSCERFQFYPRIMCSNCGSRQLQWVDADGSGTVASFTVVRRGISAGYDAPYIVVLIDLSEGPRMMSQLEDVAPDDPRVRVGAQVQVGFKAWSTEINLPVFRLLD